jgi:hypothetical protein
MITNFMLSRAEDSLFFMLISGFLIVLSNLLENVSSLMFAKIIPSNYEIGIINAGVLINNISMLGRLLGCLLLYIFSSFRNYDLINIVFTITFGFYVFVLLLTLLLYSDLRIKAIARLMRNKSMKKHKSGEFS